MRAVAWTLLATAFLPFVPTSNAVPPLEPVALTGMLDAEGSLVLQWTEPLTVTVPDAFVVVRTYLGESETPLSDTVQLPGDTQTWTDRAPPAGAVIYTVYYKLGVDDSPGSNPALRGPWPHCAVVLLLLVPPPPWYDLQPECLFPLPELPPDEP